MMNRKKLIALCCGFIMIMVFAAVVQAQDEIGTNAVGGKNYVCFFVTPLAVVNTGVEFASGGGLTIQSFPGYGFYAAVTEVFTGAYWALNATIGQTSGDVIILLIGSSFAQLPVIAGTGTIIVQYSRIIPLVFFGWEVASET